MSRKTASGVQELKVAGSASNVKTATSAIMDSVEKPKRLRNRTKTALKRSRDVWSFATIKENVSFVMAGMVGTCTEKANAENGDLEKIKWVVSI